MKITDKASFDIVAESWYQRTHRLREYSEDESKDANKRAQALGLFFIMYLRMVGNILPMSIKLSQLLMPKEYTKGGVPAKINFKPN